MKKVLFTATVDSHILQFHLPFLKLFKEKGYEVHVATNGDEEIPYCDVKHKVTFERSPFKINNLKAINQLKKVCESEKFDIIHTHTPMGSVVTRLAARNSRKKHHTRVIYTAHGLHFFKGAPIINWLLFYPVEKYLSKYTDTLILINKEDYDRCKRKFKKCKDIQYVPGVGIDEEKFNFEMTKKEKLELRKSLGLKEKDFVMIYPAELNKNKNQGMIIDAIEELSKKYKDIKVILPGVDSYNGKYRQLVKEKGLEEYIKFLGYRKDIPKLLKISNVALATSYREGLPLNVMEAMYEGLPIIATDCRGQNELVKDHINGYLITIGDQNRFTECVEKLYLSRNDNDRFGEQSKYIVKEYLLDKIIAKLEKIYFKKKKIIHVLASNKFSGAENVVCTIINNTEEEYSMYYCSPEGPIENNLKEMNINYIPIKRLSIKEIKRVIKKINPDIIHAHDFKASIYASFLSKYVEIISHIHKNDPKMKVLSFKSVIYYLISGRLKKIVVVSKSIWDEMYFKKKINNKIIVLSNYIDKDKIIKKSRNVLSKETYDFCYIGRLSWEKNPLAFIEIFYKISMKNNRDSLKAILIGDGPLKKDCIDLINKYNLQNKVYVIGFQLNPYPYISASKICIMPSKFEGFGIAAIEALILNKPVFNSGVGGLKGIFKDYDELICNNIDEYVYKITNYMKNNKNNDYTEILNLYCNKNKYLEELFNIYE